MRLLSLLAFLMPTLVFAQEPVLNKEGRDIQTVYASVGPRLLFNGSVDLGPNELRIMPEECEALDGGRFDCTEALRRELNRSAGYETIVLLRPFVLQGDGRSFPVATSCSLIELRSIMRRAIWENKNFEGIGFYADGRLSFFDKNQLLAQKEVFLLSNNEPALLHSFIDVGLCQKAQRQGEAYEFKAFAQFKGATTDGARVWENRPQNYRLSLLPAERGFDRTLDFIRP